MVAIIIFFILLVAFIIVVGVQSESALAGFVCGLTAFWIWIGIGVAISPTYTDPPETIESITMMVNDNYLEVKTAENIYNMNRDSYTLVLTDDENDAYITRKYDKAWPFGEVRVKYIVNCPGDMIQMESRRVR